MKDLQSSQRSNRILKFLHLRQRFRSYSKSSIRIKSLCSLMIFLRKRKECISTFIFQKKFCEHRNVICDFCIFLVVNQMCKCSNLTVNSPIELCHFLILRQSNLSVVVNGLSKSDVIYSRGCYMLLKAKYFNFLKLVNNQISIKDKSGLHNSGRAKRAIITGDIAKSANNESKVTQSQINTSTVEINHSRETTTVTTKVTTSYPSIKTSMQTKKSIVFQQISIQK